MENALTQEQADVLFEFVNYVKRDSPIITVDMVEKQMHYDLSHGKGESIEILNRFLYDIIKTEKLTEEQIRALAKMVARREAKWIVSSEIEPYDASQIIKDGFGYVILDNGDRVDESAEMYKEERERFNSKRKTRLANRPTNGKEYLK